MSTLPKVATVWPAISPAPVALPPDFLGSLLQSRARQRCQHDAAALCRKTQCDAPADAFTGAGHDCDLVL
jgi:hypothetical protein